MIDNVFQDNYFLNKDGSIYNYKTGKTMIADKEHMFALKTNDNKYKRISLKKLYKMVYHQQFCIDKIENLEGQQWKQIDTKGSGYFVSTKGRVKSYHGYEAHLLKPYPNQRGYYRVDIRIDKERHCKLVHRLVAAAFLPIPEDINMQLHHIDFDKANNNAENLQWIKAAQHKKIHNERKSNNVSAKSEKDIDIEKQ